MQEETSKPHTHNSMFMDAVVLDEKKNADVKSYITNLSDVDILYKENDIVELQIDWRGKEPGLLGSFNNLFLCVTDDPYAEWGDDWGHLGCFRIQFAIQNAQVTKDKIICGKDDFQIRLFVPDRHYGAMM